MPEANINYSRSYLYDPFGQIGALGYGATTALGANVFTAAATEALSAVAFYTTTVGASYEVSIYTGVSGAPSTGTLEGGAVNTTGSFPYAGYHTVVLSRPVSLVAGKKFAVVVKFTTPGYDYPIPIEQRLNGYDSAATASAGQSYVRLKRKCVDRCHNMGCQHQCQYSGVREPTAPDAPTAVTAAASVITADHAQINGTVNDNGAVTTVSFDYGLTASYGAAAAATPRTVSAGAGSTLVAATLTGLVCNTTYHYRVKGVNGVGTGNGSDLTFATLFCPTFPCTVSKTGTGSGTIASVPTGIDCGSDCTESYAGGTSVTLTATPAAGSKFAGWSGACTGTGSCTVTMSAAKSVAATFTALPKYTLTVVKSGTGTVTSDPAGIACGSDCSEAYISGSTVALSASPETGSTFAGWSGACSGSGGCTVTMSAAKSVSASFRLSTYPIAAVANPVAGGTVTCTPNPVTHGASSTCTATPKTGYTLGGFSGACTGASCKLTNVTEAQSVAANFSPKTYPIAAIASPAAGGTVTCTPNPATHGSASTCTATANAGYTFSAFSGACTGASCILTNVTAAKSVTASFRLKTYPVAAAANPVAGGTAICTPNPVSHGGSSTCTATPKTGYTLGGFSGACTGASCKLTDVTSASVTAIAPSTLLLPPSLARPPAGR